MLACSLLFLFTAPAFAQAPATANPAPAGTQIALIDMGHIFKNHAAYNVKRDAIKAKGKLLTDAVAQQRQQLTAGNEKLKQFQAGSLEYKQLEAQLTQQASDFQVQNELKRRELMLEEVRISYETYQEVQAAVEKFAVQYNIQLVIRYDRDKMDPTDPESIRRGVLNPVIQHAGLDITDHVLKLCNQVASGGGGLPR
jgi:Skp family chaperone for outer membrane proteins